MPDVKDVIKGLEEMLEDSKYNDSVQYNPWADTETLEDALALLKAQEPETSDAPKSDNNVGCWYDITHNYTLEQVVSALKAQEPRVMTLWEAVGIIDRPVYLERNVLMPDKSVNRQECWALVCATDDDRMIRLATPYGEEKWHVGAYGIGWRCWTSRPTDEQREKEPWNG